MGDRCGSGLRTYSAERRKEERVCSHQVDMAQRPHAQHSSRGAGRCTEAVCQVIYPDDDQMLAVSRQVRQHDARSAIVFPLASSRAGIRTRHAHEVLVRLTQRRRRRLHGKRTVPAHLVRHMPSRSSLPRILVVRDMHRLSQLLVMRDWHMTPLWTMISLVGLSSTLQRLLGHLSTLHLRMLIPLLDSLLLCPGQR
ncbi:hypothetical protein PIB30_101444 [Stylosanthes scabra]|uniref:Uncharacterized protein n=1 Tax=Stylosanthes scabra TaxID=79078 RepID=A0ABU6TWZ2_9FABA|nr:hypothetical protein [Stylosanthes scabra]